MKKTFIKFNKKVLAFFTVLILVFAQVVPASFAKAETKAIETYVRVEGLEGTIVEGKSSGVNAFDALEALLKQNNIDIKAKDDKYGKYIESINGIKAAKFGGWDGWMYYIKNGSKVESAQSAIDGYKLKEGDNIVVYYGDFNTPFINSIRFEPSVVKAQEPFNMYFEFKTFDYTQNKDIIVPIKNAKVIIDKSEYTTDEKGSIHVTSLKSGEHTYSISGYDKDKLPKVIMDKGLFTIDNANPPIVQYDDEKFKEKDNTKTIKDIDKELETTLAYIKNNSANPWAALALSKFNIKAEESFIEEWAKEIKKEGIKDLSATDLETKIIALSSMGYSPYDFQGYDLVKELLNRDINDFYNNEIVFALLAYNYANISGQYKITEEKLINTLINSKLSYEVNGNRLTGWTWFGEKIDPDMTGAVISALSPYYRGKKVAGVDNEKVKIAIENAVNTLSIMQNASGDIIGQYGPASETNSFVIVALTSIGINPEGDKFTKEKGDLVSALLSYKGDNGQYNHDDNLKNNYLSTEEALRALITLKEFKLNSIYDYYISNIDAKALPSYISKTVVDKEEPQGNKEDNKEEVKIDTVEVSNTVENKGEILPKTGSLLNMTSMLTAASLLIVLGIKTIRK